MRIILLIYLLCRCNILLFIVTLIVLLYLIPISFTSFSSYRINVSGALPHCYCHLHSFCHRHHHHRPCCQLSFLHQLYLLHHHHHHHPCLRLLPHSLLNNPFCFFIPEKFCIHFTICIVSFFLLPPIFLLRYILLTANLLFLK